MGRFRRGPARCWGAGGAARDDLKRQQTATMAAPQQRWRHREDAEGGEVDSALSVLSAVRAAPDGPAGAILRSAPAALRCPLAGARG